MIIVEVIAPGRYLHFSMFSFSHAHQTFRCKSSFEQHSQDTFQFLKVVVP